MVILIGLGYYRHHLAIIVIKDTLSRRSHISAVGRGDCQCALRWGNLSVDSNADVVNLYPLRGILVDHENGELTGPGLDIVLWIGGNAGRDYLV
ncbi:hypothetical protein ES703_69210 [subsurface metagenome]